MRNRLDKDTLEPAPLPLNPLEMPVRAENMSLKLLLRVRDSISGPLDRQMKSLVDFFSHENSYCSRRFQLGLKGWGKTLSVMLALNVTVEREADFKPLMLIFDRERRKPVMYNPLRIAAREVWGERLKFYRRPFNEIFEESSCIIIDDIHYIFESLAECPSFFPSFLTLLEKTYQKSLEGSKTVFISEDLLFTYAEIFNNERLDSLIAKFGLLPRISLHGVRKMWELDPMALREVPYFSFEEWFSYIRFYKGFELGPYTAQILYKMNKSPRALIKFSMLFEGQSCVSDEDFLKCAMNRLKRRGVNEEDIEVYEKLFHLIPIIEYKSAIEFAERYFREANWWGKGSIAKFLKYLSNRFLTDYEKELKQGDVWVPPTDYYSARVGRTIHRRGYWKSGLNSPPYVLKRAKKFFSDYELKSLISKYLEEYLKVLNLLKSLGGLWSAKQESYKESMEKSILEVLSAPTRIVNPYFFGKGASLHLYFRRILESSGINVRKALKLYSEGILYVPFEIAFSDYLREEPSSKIIERLMKIITGRRTRMRMKRSRIHYPFPHSAVCPVCGETGTVSVGWKQNIILISHRRRGGCHYVSTMRHLEEYPEIAKVVKKMRKFCKKLCDEDFYA